MSINKNTLKIYWYQIRKYKLSFFISLFSIPIAGLALYTLLPYFLSQTIGGLSMQDQEMVNRNIYIASGVALVGIGLNLLGFQALLRHEAKVRFELARQTFTDLIGKDLRFFVDEKVGALTSRYIDFLRSQVYLQDLLIMRSLSFIISVATGLVIIGLQSPLLALVLTGLLIFITMQVKYSIKFRTPYRMARKELIAESNGKVADSLTNSLVVKTFANEKSELKYLDKVNASYRSAYIKDFRLMSFEGSVRLLVMAATQIIAIIICVNMVLEGRIDMPIAIFLLVYLQRIAYQLFELGEMINGYDQALLEASPMSEILTKPSVVQDKPGAIMLKDINPTVLFKDVSYQYQDGRENVLSDVSLVIPAGQKVGLVGHSGAGKTTVTHLLLRFADVTKGSIKIDKQDLRDVTQESLRQNIAYVPQEPMLFHRSLRENIAYGKPNATDDEVRTAALKANALEFIESLPNGFDTLVGERGVKLSGGQRQRVAIARAILKDAPILVLDEATSALDSESEKLIQEALGKLMQGRTSIVIAHRLSTIAKLDRIIVLDKGKIIEDGTHAELLAKNGTYAKLWSHQSGGFIEE